MQDFPRFKYNKTQLEEEEEEAKSSRIIPINQDGDQPPIEIPRSKSPPYKLPADNEGIWERKNVKKMTKGKSNTPSTASKSTANSNLGEVQFSYEKSQLDKMGEANTHRLQDTGPNPFLDTDDPRSQSILEDTRNKMDSLAHEIENVRWSLKMYSCIFTAIPIFKITLILSFFFFLSALNLLTETILAFMAYEIIADIILIYLSSKIPNAAHIQDAQLLFIFKRVSAFFALFNLVLSLTFASVFVFDKNYLDIRFIGDKNASEKDQKNGVKAIFVIFFVIFCISKIFIYTFYAKKNGNLQKKISQHELMMIESKQLPVGYKLYIKPFHKNEESQKE
jgi:hypothetical protein